MKTYIKSFVYGLLTVVLLSGCEGFMDKQPLDQVSSETFWKSKSDVQKGLTATYVQYRSQVVGGMGAGNGSAMDLEALTDNAYSTSGFQSLQNIAQGGMSASTTGAVSLMWTDMWKGIARCNYFLDNIDRDDVKKLLTDTEYKKYKGEALFNRCYFYFMLVQCYGEVPLVTHVVTSDMPYREQKRDPVDTVMTQLYKDIDEAITGLPLVAYTNGHAVRGSAILLKTRMLMYDKKYADAATTAYSLIGDPQNPHKLADDFAGIFFGKQANNTEIMFSVQYSSPDDMHQFDQYTGSRMSCYPLGDLAKSFEEKSPGVDDPRKHMTLIMVGDPWVMYKGASGTFSYPGDTRVYSYSSGTFPPRGKTPITSESSVPAWHMAWKKGVNPALNQARDKISSQHCVLMRYADLLLLYAEAMFESEQGTDAKALKALNDVRGRVGVGMPAKTELTREIIRNERRVELAYEGIRYYDLKRWDIAKDVIPLKITAAPGSGVNAVKCKWDGNLWPIPQNEMNIMGPGAGWTNNAPYSY